MPIVFVIGGKVKYELRVTRSNPQVTNSNPRVTSLNTRVASSNPRVKTSNSRVRRQSCKKNFSSYKKFYFYCLENAELKPHTKVLKDLCHKWLLKISM